MKYPDDYINKILCGDCLEIMKGIPNNSVFTFTDIPYNVGKDYGNYKDNLPIPEYLGWIESVVKEVKRISEFNAWYVPKKWHRNLWNMLGEDYQEIILPFSPSGPIRYGFSNQFQTVLTNARPIDVIQNVWYGCDLQSLGYFSKESNCGHPGYTSLDVSSRVVKYLSNEDDIIFDPFGGSGSTFVASKKHGHRWIGIEINPDYCKIAEQRLAQEILI